MLTLAGEVGAERVIQTALAMYLLYESHPRRFLSDQAFLHQLVRRVRGLASVNAATYWDHKTRKTKKVYRDTPPRTIAMLAGHLQEAFGLAGLQFARHEVGLAYAEERERQQQQQALSQAVEALR